MSHSLTGVAFFLERGKKMKMKILFSLLMLTILSFMTINSVSASQLNFGVKIELPENQKDTQKSYFDLEVKANQKQTIFIELTNTTNRDVTLEPKINEAKTNNNGNVQYDQNTIKRDVNLKKAITDYAKVQNEIVIPSKDKVRLPIEIEVPKEGFEGILLGGILLQQKDSELEHTHGTKEKAGIKNSYAYLVALKLTEKKQNIKPELRLNKVQANQKNYRNVITANLQNKTPILLNQLQVKAKIFKNEKLIYSHEQKDMQMAPISNFDFAIPLKGEALKAGKYKLELDAKSFENTWHFIKNFEIKPDEAKQLNSIDVTLKKNNNCLFIVIGIFILMLGVLSVFILKKKRTENK